MEEDWIHSDREGDGGLFKLGKEAWIYLLPSLPPGSHYCLSLSLSPVSAQRSLGEWWRPLRVQDKVHGRETKKEAVGGQLHVLPPHNTPPSPDHPNTLISQSLRPLLARPAERPTPWGPAPLPPQTNQSLCSLSA